jgi:hypothetical protein
VKAAVSMVDDRYKTVDHAQALMHPDRDSLFFYEKRDVVLSADGLLLRLPGSSHQGSELSPNIGMKPAPRPPF